MKKFFLFIILASTFSYGQENWDDFSGEEKAFFYNITRRRKILKPELLHLFEFTDSIPWINDTLPDYKYVERQVVKSPEKLILHTDQMARKPDGLVADLAVHYALWELDQALKYRNSELEQHEHLKPVRKRFEKYVLEKVPQSAVQTLSSGDFVVTKAVRGYYEPSLQSGDKKSGLANSSFGMTDQMLILNAIAHGQEKYVRERSFEIFQVLGGKTDTYNNYISAAGDGSGYSSLEGGIFTPYNKVLPDEKNLYRFNVEKKIKKKTYEETHGKRPKPDEYYLSVNSVITKEFKTSADQNTVIHFDVIGYHPERQTTVAVQKGGNSYILYGNNSNRMLSPDSTYGEGATYWRLMWELENIHIEKLNEALYGKRGYEYWIDVYEKKIEKTLLLIKKTEYKLDQLRHKPEGKPKIKKKKFKKKNLGNSDQAGTGHPTSALSKNDKKKNVEQNRLNHLNTQLIDQKQKLAQLKLEMEKAYFILQDYKSILDQMQKHMGYLVMEYEQEGDIYTFNDGTEFNYATQEFTFKGNGRMESFRMNHIAFGKTVFASSVEESFVHYQMSNIDETDPYTFEKIVAKSESKVAMSRSDSIQMMEIFRLILDKELDVEMTINAGGILAKDKDGYFRDSVAVADPYNKDNELNDEAWKYRADWDTKVNLSVTVWQDKMLPFNFEQEHQKGFTKLKKKYPELSEIDYTSAKKAQLQAYKWVEQMKSLVPIWFEKADEQSKILRELNGLSFKNVQFVNGRLSSKISFKAPES